MIYGGHISVDANTAAASAKETAVIVSAGILYKFLLYFPPGSSGLLHVQVFDGAYQLFPATIGESFTGDNIKYEFEDTYDKSAAPHVLVVKSWNLDTEYAHAFEVWIGQVSRDDFIARFIPNQQINDALVQAVSVQASTEASRKAMLDSLISQYAAEED